MAVPVKKGEELALRIDSLAYGGNGVGRHDGFVVFVRGGLPGDSVRARVTKVKRGFAEGVVADLVEPSAQRVDAPCRHFGVCGGCRFQDLAYAAQVAEKERQVRDSARPDRTVRRSAARADRPGRVAVRLPEQARVLVQPSARTGSTSASTAPGAGTRSSASRSASSRPMLGNAIRLAVRDWAREERLEPYDQRAGTGYLRHLVVREGRNTGQALVVLVTAPGERFETGLLRRRPPTLSRGAIDPLGDQRHAGGADEPADGAPVGIGRDRGGDPRAPVPSPPVCLPADEHRDGRAAVCARPRVRGL